MSLVRPVKRGIATLAFVPLLLILACTGCGAHTGLSSMPAPSLSAGHPVDWWFVFKFNAASFPGCKAPAVRSCRFGGQPKQYSSFGQQFVYASSENKTLQEGNDCLGDTTTDPVGATFDQIYNGELNYVVWNDQFYDDPPVEGCTTSCSSPWGHSKGMLAWDANGNGLVMQVSTPSWPASGNHLFPRKTDGNTLGCVQDNNVLVSQHFFALRLTRQDVVKVLIALNNASVVTVPANPQIVRNGGPVEIQQLVSALGSQSKSHAYIDATLSTGVRLISKPSNLQVPPWQMVSALLGGHSLRAATWWTTPDLIDSTTASTPVGCWDPSLGRPGAVEIATTGKWGGKTLGLEGGPDSSNNHAKIGVAISGAESIFGDMNQQGTLSGPNPKCSASQNGRGGLFYVIEDQKLHDSIAKLISGASAPVQAP